MVRRKEWRAGRIDIFIVVVSRVKVNICASIERIDRENGFQILTNRCTAVRRCARVVDNQQLSAVVRCSAASVFPSPQSRHRKKRFRRKVSFRMMLSIAMPLEIYAEQSGFVCDS